MSHFTKSLAVLFTLTFLASALNIEVLAENFAQASQQRPGVLSSDTYEQTLDLVFPRTIPESPDARVEFVLRFEPSRGTESQIVIAWRNSKVLVVEYSPANGSVWDRLSETLNQKGTIDTSQVAKTISVRHRLVTATAERGKHWRSSFFASLLETAGTMKNATEKSDQSGTATIVLDGTAYRLTYLGYPADISLLFQDVNQDSITHSSFKIVDWMNSVRSEVAQMK